MAVTRGTVVPIRPGKVAKSPAFWRGAELLWLLIAALLVCNMWSLAGHAKLRRAQSATPLLDVTRIEHEEQLHPALQVFANPADRDFAARKIFAFLSEQEGSIPNTGALARIKLTREEVLKEKGLDHFQTRAKTAKETFSLFTPQEFALFKSQIAVRTLSAFEQQLRLWAGIILGAFLLVHLVWSLRRFDGPWLFLPALLLLTGLGFGLMVSLRDPVRDTLIFVPYAQGVAGGVLAMMVASFIDWERAASALSFVPLLGAGILSVALIFLGSGPTGSDARVNLGPVQPVEAIKILLVFFLAGYFAKRWPLLRALRERSSLAAKALPFLNLPKFEYAGPVFAGVAVALLFFYLQRDLGPALVFACLFLSLYSIARARVGLAFLGFCLLFGGFAFGYIYQQPKTVHDRVSMWFSPWNNTVRGGDQVVHSMWAMASGGINGTGPALGSPETIPAGYTDLILSALGEEWGFIGIFVVFLLYGLILWMGLRIARRARTDYALFLSLGLVLLLSGELLLISAGILDLFPLSGVATPFLSYGRTAMFANFVIAGILLALSRQPGETSRTSQFHPGLRWIEIGLAALILTVVGKAAYIQIAQADVIAGKPALVKQADEHRRYVYNPRLMEAARGIQRGSIYDRTGLPLATSDWKELESHREQYKQLGIDIDTACNRADFRHYPLGAASFHLLGDLRTRANWGAHNSSLVERDSAIRLQGYDDRAHIETLKDEVTGQAFNTVRYDYRELLPLLRHRWEPNHPAVKRIRDRERNVVLSIHAGLQKKAFEILKTRLAEQKLQRGSAVVMEPATGDILASVNWPAPEFDQQKLMVGEAAGAMLDRARYGLYPPGSTFKIVTAIAAMRIDPSLAQQTYQCLRLPDGRSGNFVGNSKRPIRDDELDHAAHGTLDMHRAIAVSCNAYFAQLGTYKVGAAQMLETAKMLGISVSDPADEKHLTPQMPQTSYGQGQVVASPFQMARVASTIAAGGKMPFGRWETDSGNLRSDAPKILIPTAAAATLGRDMRGVVLTGTGRKLTASKVPIAGKTGTAELGNAPSHAWFIGFAPYAEIPAPQQVAFSVIAENGRYGGTAAAPIAGDLVAAAQQFGLIPGGNK